MLNFDLNFDLFCSITEIYIPQGTTCRGYDSSRVRLGKHLRSEGTRRESRISGTSCRGYEFAGVRLVQLPIPQTETCAACHKIIVAVINKFHLRVSDEPND